VRLVDGGAAARAVLEAQVTVPPPAAPPPMAPDLPRAGRVDEPRAGTALAAPSGASPRVTPPSAPPPLPARLVDDLVDAVTERLRLDVERTYGTAEA